MSPRKLTSLTALTSFVFLILTSVILYIVPAGRVAYWANWKLWGLTKTDWTNFHVTLGVLFLLAIALHIFYNWRPILNYLKNKAKQTTVFTAEFTVALALVFVTFVGTLFAVPPFAQIVSLGEWFKDQGARKYGEPPYGHAELSSLKTFAARMGLDLQQAMENLSAAGVRHDDESQTIEAIATANQLTPQQVYNAMRPTQDHNAAFAGEQTVLPDSPPPGTGNLPLADLAGQFNLNLKILERGLADRGVKASSEQSLKQIGEANGMAPLDVYAAIREIVAASGRSTP